MIRKWCRLMELCRWCNNKIWLASGNSLVSAFRRGSRSAVDYEESSFSWVTNLDFAHIVTNSLAQYRDQKITGSIFVKMYWSLPLGLCPDVPLLREEYLNQGWASMELVLLFKGKFYIVQLNISRSIYCLEGIAILPAGRVHFSFNRLRWHYKDYDFPGRRIDAC